MAGSHSVPVNVNWVSADQVMPPSLLVLYQMSSPPERSEIHTTHNVPSAAWVMAGSHSVPVNVNWVPADQVMPPSELVLYQMSSPPERSEVHTTHNVPSAAWTMAGK